MTALGWGALSASSLVIGAWLGVVRKWPDGVVGGVLAFGAGALISAVSFELVEAGTASGGAAYVGIGLAIGALTFYFADRYVEKRFSKPGQAAGTSLALGAFLDGIPEQAVLGISIAEGGAVSVGLLVAIFVSNLPEAIGSATEMRAGGQTPRTIYRLWIAVAAVCALASVVGWAIADISGGHLEATVNGFAGGALLVMLVDSMIPDASSKLPEKAGLATVLGFAVATALSTLSP